jgi:hypothetical protein
MTLKKLTTGSIFIGLMLVFGCGSLEKVQTEPQVITPKEPSIEELRTPVSKDATIYKALEVIKEYGKLSKEYISYDKFQRLTKGQAAAALDPDWFYDSYKLNMNEEDHWILVIFGTAQRAMARDPRIGKIMTDLPGKSIAVELKMPSGKKYLLSDAEADGILDFAKDANEKKTARVDIQLLDQMQEKYTWILGLIKKHYKKINK